MLTLEKIMTELKVNSVNEVVAGGRKGCGKKKNTRKHCTSTGAYSCTTTYTYSCTTSHYGCY